MKPLYEIPHAIWPAESLASALTALLSAAGLPQSPTIASIPERTLDACQGELAGPIVSWIAGHADAEADPIYVRGGELEKVTTALPALLVCAHGGYLAALRMRGREMELVAADGGRRWVALPSVLAAVRSIKEQQAIFEFEHLARLAGLNPGRTDSSRQAARGKRYVAGWGIRPLPARTLPRFLHQSNAFSNAGVLLGAHVAQYLLWLASWWILGKLSFSGHMDRGWLMAWGLLLLTMVPLRVLETWAQGVLALGLGAALKRHLLRGTLRLPPDQVRTMGTGDVLSQVFESEAVELLALSGGVAGVLAVVELVVSCFVLGPLSIPLGLVCIALLVLGRMFWKRYQDWTATRMAMTHDLIESMVGHRTRLAQERVEERHLAEDSHLDRYLADSKWVDRIGACLVGALPRCWLIGGLLCLAPTAVSGMNAESTLALRLGGVLLAWAALQKLTGAAIEIAGTAVAAVRIAPLFRAGAGATLVGASAPDPPRDQVSMAKQGEPLQLLELDRISFQYPESSASVLQSTSLTIQSGERVLMEGSSGGGKSTLAAVMSGLREPTSGVLLSGGLDRFTLGEDGWRRRVANAPQFHDNHILTETLAYNLLLGRPWPPRASDVAEAEELCRELGLGDLLDRMPAGLAQMVGEGGWRLSQGECSRIFLARALLQGAPVTILDESFGALDPENLKAAMECTLERTDALVVIAHP